MLDVFLRQIIITITIKLNAGARSAQSRARFSSHEFLSITENLNR